mmetsp:Transcript_33164/g.61297  ORF Transcript_33164/g.61297 Transcript_33164/m.61297 type:complete len:80 (-) Transcript_33164:189-428(-)
MEATKAVVLPSKPQLPTRPVPMPVCLPCAPLRPTPTSAQPGGTFVNQAKAFPCKECRQEFDTQKELDLHTKYIHRSKED